MAEDLYVAVELIKATEAGITRELNEMAQKGWQFVQGWDRSAPTVRTVLVFERSSPKRETGIPKRIAVERNDVGDRVLLDEMEAADRVRQPVEDPLMTGLAR